MKNILQYAILIILMAMITESSAQESYAEEVEKFRTERDAMFSDPAKSPLAADQLTSFEGLQYFPIDERYSVKAILKALENEDTKRLSMSAGGREKFQKYGEISFMLDGREYTMDVYRKADLPDLSDQKGELFIPFMDASSGNETSGYGRYISVEIPIEGNEIILDFNKAVNPYAAYNSTYSSPLAPDVNTIDLSLLAGERKYEDR
ncbi:MAG: DUF1684 domain-containing protein [Bacteroidales bacterium]